MRKYFISVKVDTRVEVEVEAESFEEAFGLAEDKARDKGLKDAEWVDVEPVHAERDDGREADYGYLPYHDRD